MTILPRWLRFLPFRGSARRSPERVMNPAPDDSKPKMFRDYPDKSMRAWRDYETKEVG